MQQLYSPHILSNFLLRPIDFHDRKQKDLIFYEQQDYFEAKKIDSGLDALQTPRLIYNILNELDRPKIIKENLNIALEIFNEDILRIESQLASGESPIEEQKNIEKELAELNSKKNLLIKKQGDAVSSSTNMLKFRNFIPLALLNYEQYLKFITTSEDSLFFATQNYIRFHLNQKEYEYYEILFSSARTPQDLLELSLNFISKMVDINAIALCSYEPAISGFNLYFNKNNTAAYNTMTLLIKQFPEQVEYLHEFDYWIIKENSEPHIFNQLFNLFDIWFDYTHISIYSKLDSELQFDLKVKPCELYNSDYIYGTLFDHMDTPVKIDGEALISKLVLSSKNPSPYDILFFDGVDFKKANNNVIWTYAEMILIQYKCESEPDIEFMAIYSAKDNNFLFICENLGHISDKCLLLFKNTISLLNINAFEQVNPNVILANS